MKTTRLLLLTIIALSLAPAPARAKAPAAQGLEMHRQGAGEPDASGWSDARSTHGGFSVSVPGKFNDFSVHDRAADGTALVAHVVGTRTQDGVKFTALTLVRADRRVAGDALETIARKMDGKRKDVKYRGMAGVEVALSSPQSAGVMRVLRGKDRIYQLIVEYPNAVAASMPENVRRFMESLRVR
ncbi:hypothetical protein [Anaeromyxobacter oryzae]|uniref:PsbP C-terminal domain-containing protein n=1 Tax=Anaeromyxobacter oryzae TaxID=2918170 RepID=A0ABM7WPG5_9BACT|nr:hypothetical protein [Anaeromyxobacter oryzae]BDG01348.1 hypothetical protein AMOR_03440 [Anaeromyxobacter oryzae]